MSPQLRREGIRPPYPGRIEDRAEYSVLLSRSFGACPEIRAENPLLTALLRGCQTSGPSPKAASSNTRESETVTVNTARIQSRGPSRDERRGAALVEMAACLPVFMLTLLGIIEFGRAMSVAQMLNAAAREGCRAAGLDGSTDAAITSMVRQQIVSTVNCAAQSVNVAIAVTSGTSGSPVVSLSVAEPRDTIAISVSVPHSAVSYSVSRWLQGRMLRGQCTMRHE